MTIGFRLYRGLSGLAGRRIALAACAAAFLIYSALGLITHWALGTSAFDLSVFDYALWTTASGGPLGYVPMFRHSLFAQHFMPTLLLLAPLSHLFASPVYLIVLQVFFYAAAGFALFCLASDRLTVGRALALLAAFLLSRRTHGAVTSYFYIESAEPLLIFGAVLAWSRGRHGLYWVLAVLALGCKEDMAIYLFTFGAMLAYTNRDRKTGAATMAVAGLWLLVALFVAIPYWRGVYGLGAANVFIDGRYGFHDSGFTLRLLGRLVSIHTISRLFTVSSSVAFLCWLAPGWLAIALPGIAINLVASWDTAQADLSGHYLWPILPWVFLAAVHGAGRLGPKADRWLPIAIVLVALIEVQLPRSILSAPLDALPASAEVELQLKAVAPTGRIVAQPNLIPHLPRQREVYGLGVYSSGQPEGDFVLLTSVGDLWPLDAQGVADQVERLQADPRYEQVANGPLYAFRKR